MWVVFVLALCVASVLMALVLRKKNLHLWISAYVFQKLSPKPSVKGPRHIIFAFVDHYEPRWGRVDDLEIESRRVDAWMNRYPLMADKHRDADGRVPQHTFFYPEEEYRKVHLDKLADLCRRGYGEVEVHIHHDNDTADNFRKTMTGFVDLLRNEHGFLPDCPKTGKPLYAFIHGNWCLNNSRPDGRYCGVNDESIILRDTGCYADFTMPSAPSDTQTAKINSIYYATDIPGRSKSHDNGVDVEVGKQASGDLLLIQGPLALNWKRRKFGIMPSIESSDIRKATPPSPDRVDLWVDCNIHVKGRPEWVFVKIHTHGTQDMDIDTLLGEPVDQMFSYLEEKYNDGKNYVLHYVNAREMYNIVKAAEDGKSGNPNQYRDYLLKPPVYKH
jgi:hypothetical protein